jgi:hypothetical protein
MAQLIKLQDYVSRYAQDIYLYPARYVVLKKQQWTGLKHKWENGTDSFEFNDDQNELAALDQQDNFFQKIKNMVRPTDASPHEAKSNSSLHEDNEQDQLMDDQAISMIGNIKSIPALKQHFLDQLLPFQLKWASSTLMEKSFIDQDFAKDPKLKFLLQRFPDTFLILYKPIFLLKKAPVEAELIMITPAAAICLSFLEAEEDAVFIGSKERFWSKKIKARQEKLLNPLIGLNRTGKIVNTLFDLYGVELPVQKIVVSRNGFIDDPLPPYGIQYIDKRMFEEWFMGQRALKSSLKHMQLKAAQVLLQYCQTTSFRRLEWEKDNQN